MAYRHRDCDAAIMADNLAGACPGCGGPERLTLDELLQAVEAVNAHLDSTVSAEYGYRPPGTSRRQ